MFYNRNKKVSPVDVESRVDKAPPSQSMVMMEFLLFEAIACIIVHAPSITAAVLLPDSEGYVLLRSLVTGVSTMVSFVLLPKQYTMGVVAVIAYIDQLMQMVSKRIITVRKFMIITMYSLAILTIQFGISLIVTYIIWHGKDSEKVLETVGDDTWDTMAYVTLETTTVAILWVCLQAAYNGKLQEGESRTDMKRIIGYAGTLGAIEFAADAILGRHIGYGLDIWMPLAAATVTGTDSIWKSYLPSWGVGIGAAFIIILFMYAIVKRSNS